MTEEVVNSVSSNDLFVTSSLHAVHNTPQNFVAGKISNCISHWFNYTHDPWILGVVKGYNLEFTETPYQNLIPRELKFSQTECEAVHSEIRKFIEKGIVQKVTFEPNSNTESQFISTIFLRPKKDGTYRVILNLKELNQFVGNYHFKMETLKSALTLIKPACWFCSLDIKDAYYSVNIAQDSRKFLRFQWNNDTYEFTCLPMGLASSPRIFTKLMKPIFSHLRKHGLMNVIYIDDILLVGESQEECYYNVSNTVNVLDDLGFTIHPHKSVLQPTQYIQFLGFMLNSVTMTVKLTSEKVRNIQNVCEVLLSSEKVTLRQFAQLVGMLVAAEPGVEYAKLHYKQLEIEKDGALKRNKGNFEAYVVLTEQSKREIQWWQENIPIAYKPLTRAPPNITLKSDSSRFGWGGVNEDTGNAINGIWEISDMENHINYLELLAGFNTLKGLCSENKNVHIRLGMDNIVAVTYLNKQGGKIPGLNSLTKDIWHWCIERDIWISGVYVKGSTNIIADSLSRKNVDMEWKLNERVFNVLQNVCGKCDVDMFASKENYQLQNYYSYTPDPQAIGVDAFAHSWKNINCYLFPPFSLVGTVLRKVEEDRVDYALLISPIWTTQSWFPHLLHLIAGPCYILPKTDNLLMFPREPLRKHPLSKMKMGAFTLSGNVCKVNNYRKTLSKSYASHGVNLHGSNIGLISNNGCSFAIAGKLIHLCQMSL